MSELVLPPWIIPEEETHEWLDEGSSVFRSAFAPGLAQRQSYGGLRLKLSRRHTVRGEEKAQLLAIMKSTRGSYNVLRTTIHFQLRGSIGSSDLITNGTFSNGTTGWATSGSSELSLSVSDRILRVLRSGLTTNGSCYQQPSGLTQYAPYSARASLSGFLPNSNIRLQLGSSSSAASDIYISSAINSVGLTSGAGVTSTTTPFFIIRDISTGRGVSPVWVDFSFLSLSRCALVDNGLNSLLQSDELDTSWTATRASVDDQTLSTNAPDGTATADSIIEDTSATNSHFIEQTVTVAGVAGDYAFSVALKAGARTWASLQMTLTNSVTMFVNLSNGTVGTSTTGGDWANTRSYVSALGDGWYKVTLVSRKTTAGTSLTARIYIAEADNDSTFTGDGASNIYAWRATLAQSSVPTRLIQTTTSSATGTAQTGVAMYVKGLPESSNGLLLPGDWFEVNGELKQCTHPLNSDASGAGYLQFEPPLVRSPSNDDPIIFAQPMGKFLVSNIKIDNEFGTQARVSYDLEHIYE